MPEILPTVIPPAVATLEPIVPQVPVILPILKTPEPAAVAKLPTFTTLVPMVKVPDPLCVIAPKVPVDVVETFPITTLPAPALFVKAGTKPFTLRSPKVKLPVLPMVKVAVAEGLKEPITICPLEPVVNKFAKISGPAMLPMVVVPVLETLLSVNVVTLPAILPIVRFKALL